MKASVFSILAGLSSSTLAFFQLSRSGPGPLIKLWRLRPPGAKPSALASYAPEIRPIASLITLRWNHGGRNVSSATIQRGGKMTKSALARPATLLGEVSTVKIDGSGWSKLTLPIVLKFDKSYRHGA